ncbi:putative ntf2 and rrm domain containing protein [Rhypophila sp. PSN 637]
MATNGNINHGEPQYTSTSGAPPASTTSSSKEPSQKETLPKDEVGWYFVEQYYTTLSKNPDKLHLFYGKTSQFVYGMEAEVATVSVGRHDIQDRIKGLPFQDCKVRISNVDSQGSNDCIVIQVIGETSNNNADARKFVQTFVLAQQPSGYFVLNDIFRYINDDDDVVDQQQSATESSEPGAAPVETQAEPTEAQEEPKELEPKELEPPALDTAAIDKKLEEAEAPAEETPTPSAADEAVSGTAAESTEEENASEPVPAPEKAAEEVAEEVAEEEVKQPEDPKAPTPTPAAPVASVAPAAAPAPAKSLNWAQTAAKAAAAAIPKLPTAPVSTQPRPAAIPAKQPAQAAPVPKSAPSPATSRDQGNEWQTAETKRQNRPVSQVTTPSEKDGNTSAYVKFVTDKVVDEDLKRTLSAFGDMTYCDINRQKNCAFIEFETAAGFNAAVAANPHTVNGETIVVEQRRPKSTTFGGGNFNPARAGAANRGRGGFEPGRSGNQGGRGNFSGQSGRGRGAVQRGRGPSGAA